MMRNSPDPTDIPNFTLVARLARAWGVGEPTIRSWIRRGILPGVKLGSLLFVDLGKLGDVLEKNRVEVAPAYRVETSDAE